MPRMISQYLAVDGINLASHSSSTVIDRKGDEDEDESVAPETRSFKLIELPLELFSKASFSPPLHGLGMNL